VPRHRFEPVALVFGAVFVAAGVIVLAGGELTEEGRALVPAGLIALGVALLVHVGRRGRPPAPAAPLAAPPPRVDDQDLDDLFAPVDDALADWDRAHAASTAAADVGATQVDATEAQATGSDATEVQATGSDTTDAQATGTDTTDAQATETDATDAQATGTDTTPPDPEPDVTEVVDPTELYPGREPE
jgi:hypothetical protein